MGQELLFRAEKIIQSNFAGKIFIKFRVLITTNIIINETKKGCKNFKVNNT
jgi:hypothetical protein